MIRLLVLAALAGCAPAAPSPATAPLEAGSAAPRLPPGAAALRDALCATGPTPGHAASLDWLELPPCA